MGNHGMQYIYQADKINGEISKPYKDVYYMNCRGGKKLIIGRADTRIFVFTDCKNNRFQKKLMIQNTNIRISAPPPNYRSSAAPEELWSMVINCCKHKYA